VKEEILKKAQELNLLLKNSEEYKSYVEANNNVKDHSAADIMISDFRKKQQEVQQKAMEGIDIEGDLKNLQKLWDVISINPYVRAVIEAELSFGQLYGEVMQELGSGIELLDGTKQIEDKSDQ